MAPRDSHDENQAVQEPDQRTNTNHEVAPVGSTPTTAIDPAAATTGNGISDNASSDTLTSGPPSLEYTVRTRPRILFIIFFWSLVVFDSAVMPIALYFGLWYGTDLSPNAVFSIVTAAIGGVSIVEYFLRFWRLFRKNSTCRVIGGRRKYLDWFHWVFTAMWLVLMVELVVGSCPDNPPIRLLAMPPASLLFIFGFELAALEVMRVTGVKAPIRISSIPKGEPVRPGVYNLVEDIVAVDGSGGTAYRERLDRRYRASKVFRTMLGRVTLFWAVGCIAMAILTTALVFTQAGDYAYAIGWSAPFVWAALWAGITWWYVERMLRIEKQTWRKPNTTA